MNYSVIKAQQALDPTGQEVPQDRVRELADILAEAIESAAYALAGRLPWPLRPLVRGYIDRRFEERAEPLIYRALTRIRDRLVDLLMGSRGNL